LELNDSLSVEILRKSPDINLVIPYDDNLGFNTSRLEGMTKAFSCQWLGSGQFIEAAGGESKLRRIARVQVKGREEPVDLWTSTINDEARVAYAEALGNFEAGDFDTTLTQLEKYLAEFPDDKVATHLLGHTRRFLELRPPDWKGIIKFNEK
jgi:hypothetical protein